VALGDLTQGQRTFLSKLIAKGFASQFYLTDGAALSAFHLHHRRCEVLDLNSRTPFDSGAVRALVSSVSEMPPVAHRVGRRLGFLARVMGEEIKVEFVHFDFPSLAPPEPKYGQLGVDGTRDILANKFSLVLERTEPRDFADILVLLVRAHLPLAQGVEDCRRKFSVPGLVQQLRAAFQRVEKLPSWPDLDPQLLFDEARTDYRNILRELSQLTDPA